MDINAGSSKRKNSGSFHSDVVKRPKETDSIDRQWQQYGPIDPPEPPKSRKDFEIVIICALTLEADAVEGLDVLPDCKWYADGVRGYGKANGDPNTYSTGYIAGHNVVLAHMPEMGKANAAAVASNCRMSFPNIRLALVVGVCGAVPFRVVEGNVKEVVLGDVIISHGVVQYDLGAQLPDRFEPKDTLLSRLARPAPELRGFIAKLKTRRAQHRLECNTLRCLEALQTRTYLDAQYPGTDQDRLFRATYEHVTEKIPCSQAGCNDELLPRTRLVQDNPKPAVHIGLIASGDTVMKSGIHRDKIVERAKDIVAFEMESAGVWDVYPCVVIKGACDYCDSHKTGEWQPYAAAAAAAGLRSFLEEWVSSSNNDFTGIAPVQAPPLDKSIAELAPSVSSLDSEMKQKLIDLLYFNRIDDRLTNLRAAQGNTCRWFYNTPKYLAWRDTSLQSGHSGFLWIKGHPGIGKSTLMKLLFEEARAKAKHDPSQITLSFFFLARGSIEEKSTQGLYRSLLHQLFEKAKDLESALEWMTSSGARGVAENGWNEEALKQTLVHAVSQLRDRSLTIFVDALDECDKSQAINMVGFFEDLCERARETNTRLKICFSSRYYPDIRTEEENQVALEAEEGHDEDIKKYIKATLKVGGRRQIENLRLEVFNKSSGIFLWVVLVLELLISGNDISVQAMSRRLREIPPGLDDLFEKIMTRDGENLERLRSCLKIILFAERSLKPQELYFAIQLGLGIDKSGYWDHEDVQLDEMKIFVRTSSKGLAEVTRNKACEVQFIHESIRGFLMGSYSERWSGYSENLEGNCQLFLRDICLAQLIAPITEFIHIPAVYRAPTVTPSGQQAASNQLRSELNLKFPLFQYSILKVLYHANRAQQNGVDQSAFLQDFPLKRWVMMTNALEKRTIRLYSDSVSLVYILAEFNLTSLIQATRAHLQPASYFTVQCERYGPAIFAALACGSQEAACEMLTDPRICAKLPCGTAREVWAEHAKTAVKENNLGIQFVFSARRHIFGHLTGSGEVVAQAYILSGADTAVGSRNADISAYENFMKHLPVQGFKLDTPPVGDAVRLGSLLWPAGKGYIILLQQMLKAGADVNEIDSDGNTPLLSAARGGHAAAVQLLLDAGADVEPKDNAGATLLSRVVSFNIDNTITQQLLERGANVHSMDNSGRTPLSHAASMSTYSGHTKQLLDAGADPDSRDNSGQTPLSWAARLWSTENAKLLLDAGADPDSRDNCGQTPLSWAARLWRTKNAKLLLDAGADPDSRDNCGRTPLLHVALNPTYAGDSKPLLYAVPDPDSQDNSDPNLLFRPFNAEISELLLDAGADPDSQDNSGRTALSWAADEGYLTKVRILLDRGADRDLKDINGETAMSHARKGGHYGIVELLSKDGNRC
ncbi:hypothetical protein MCOR25_007442 [Pyricularia grisea]|nr:hypothetical protein MCOR25_007442 [Pyricularia grisea]